MAGSPPPVASTSVQPLNHAVKLPAPSTIGGNIRQLEQDYRISEEEAEGRGEKVVEVENKEEVESSPRNSTASNRLSNGLDSKSLTATSDSAPVLPNHSPRSSSVSQDIRLSTLSADLNSSLPNGLEHSAEQEVATAGEPSVGGALEDSFGASRHVSISEHTRELDEFLNRSSMNSLLMDDSQLENILSHREFEKIQYPDKEVFQEGGNMKSAMVRGQAGGMVRA